MHIRVISLLHPYLNFRCHDVFNDAQIQPKKSSNNMKYLKVKCQSLGKTRRLLVDVG